VVCFTCRGDACCLLLAVACAFFCICCCVCRGTAVGVSMSKGFGARRCLHAVKGRGVPAIVLSLVYNRAISPLGPVFHSLSLFWSGAVASRPRRKHNRCCGARHLAVPKDWCGAPPFMPRRSRWPASGGVDSFAMVRMDVDATAYPSQTSAAQGRSAEARSRSGGAPHRRRVPHAPGNVSRRHAA